MTRTLTIIGTGKKALADIQFPKHDPEGEVTISNLTIFSDNGRIVYYSRKQCSRHQWLLYKTVKNYLYA